MISAPLIFEPIPMERVWGGRRLEIMFGKPLPPGAPIGEVWEFVDREEAQSVVHKGPLRGLTLGELWSGHREEIFGVSAISHPSPRFPLLIKLLDARDRLSVQVHPPARLAKALNGEPKTEVWYFARCAAGARIYAGLRKGTTRASFEALLHNGQVEQALHEIAVSTGDSIFIPSGRLHAIGEGNVIIEIQQNSDSTYRVYDWNRTGLDGKSRTLHIEESLACTNFEDFEPEIEHVEKGAIADCEFFHVERLVLSNPEPAVRPGHFAIYTVLGGFVECGGEVFTPGAFFLVPASASTLTVSPCGGEAALLCSVLS